MIYVHGIKNGMRPNNATLVITGDVDAQESVCTGEKILWCT